MPTYFFKYTFLTNSLSFSLSHLNIISSFILYSFFIIIYSSYSHSQQLYFSIKNVIFTIFFVILSQESHQNLMLKILTSSNLNPSLKLFFYSPILVNNIPLLKIYCENIVVTFLNCNFFLFLFYFSKLNYIHTFLFFFFLLVFSPPHTYPTPIFIYPSFPLSSSFRISLSLSSTLSFFL